MGNFNNVLDKVLMIDKSKNKNACSKSEIIVLSLKLTFNSMFDLISKFED